MVTAEVDMSNQINNPWTKDTSLVIGVGSMKYALLLNKDHKQTLLSYCNSMISVSKKKKNPKKKSRYMVRVVSLIHAYLLYKLLIKHKEVLQKVRVCADTQGGYLQNHLYMILSHLHLVEELEHIKISMGLDKRNSIQELASKVSKGDIPPDYTLSKRDIEELIELINKLVPKNF